MSCKKDDHLIFKQSISGTVQKGPFIVGTEIDISELNSSLIQTGKVFKTLISNNTGLFEIANINLSSPYVEFSASGFYFDEVGNYLSQSPLTLTAVADITDINTVNINILTHLEKSRVEYLVARNNSFSEAKKIAQSEVLAIFGFSPEDMDRSEVLDISVNKEENAILLAISVLLQFGHGTPELTEFLSNIANDIKEDGILNNESIINDIKNAAKELSQTDIYPLRSYIEKRYEDIGSGAAIPDFEKYLSDYLVFTAEKPGVGLPSIAEITTNEASINCEINPNSLNTTVTLEYGLTPEYGSVFPFSKNPLSGSFKADISEKLTELLPGKLYHFRIKAENTLGISYSDDVSFTTLGSVPSVITKPTTNLTATGITLNASVNPNLLSTTVTFEYGKTSGYGTSVSALQNPLTGNSYISVSADISGLEAGTVYFVKIHADNSIGLSYGSEFSFRTATVSVGDNFQGGIIAYILNSGDSGYDAFITHGIIAAPSDQSIDAEWGCAYQQLAGADGTIIGSGNQNTTDIVQNCTEPGIAAKLCFDLELNGYSDWFLPDKEELNKLYLNRAAVGGFSNSWYWSSSESPANGRNACCIRFYNGEWNCGSPSFSKEIKHNVRAIRTF